MELAPIIVFVYNRPVHTRQTLTALMNNILANESELHIYVDGLGASASEKAKNDHAELKKIIREKKWCKEVFIYEASENLGLARSVQKGVTEIVNKYGKAIILEDDLITGKFFLQFMNDALEMYKNEQQVISITGYIYPVEQVLPKTFFLKGADCWGWATWKRGWDLFETNGTKLLKELELKDLTGDFDFSGSYPYTQMLRDQIEGKNNSWAILWYASAFLKNKLTLYPGRSLVQNIGIDGSGMHSGSFTDKFEVKLETGEIKLQSIPIEEHKVCKEFIAQYFRKVFGTGPKSTIEKINSKLKQIFKGGKK